MQKPLAYERADDANRRVPDEMKPVAAYSLPASHSAMSPTTKMTITAWSAGACFFPYPDVGSGVLCRQSGFSNTFY